MLLWTPPSLRQCSILPTFKTPISLKVQPVTSFTNAWLDVLASFSPFPDRPVLRLTLASNHVFSNISADPTTVKRAEFLACIVVIKDNCWPTANGSSAPSTSSLGLYEYADRGARRIGVNNGLALPKVCPMPLGNAMTSPPLPSPLKKFLTSGRMASGLGTRMTSCCSGELRVS